MEIHSQLSHSALHQTAVDIHPHLIAVSIGGTLPKSPDTRSQAFPTFCQSLLSLQLLLSVDKQKRDKEYLSK